MKPLQGKVALVTGAGQGIGRGIALALAAEGAAVAVTGRTQAKLDETAALIAERGGRALAFACDVTVGDQVRDAVARTVSELGKLDVLVNNAQDYAFGPIAGVDLDAVDAGWQSGAMGTLRFLQTAKPHLASGSVVVNVSSGVAGDPIAGTGGYAAVKAAIEAISRATALEWGGEGIRVLTLVPFARTPAVAATLSSYPELEEQILADVPLGRFGDPETEIGKTVAFLAGPDASFITGTTLAVDGGATYVH
jgi:NAD(P)-dependent dehydrogenase (short-subunit alcohol dehydrogenase family)